MDVCLVHGHEMKYDMRSGFDLCAECELEAFRKNHALWMEIGLSRNGSRRRTKTTTSKRFMWHCF